MYAIRSYYVALTGATFKLCIFDDCPNSWTGAKNWNETGGATYSTTNPKFDCAVTANWRYIYDYNIKPTIQAIPDSKRYKIDGVITSYSIHYTKLYDYII